jgi:hypothetical protein
LSKANSCVFVCDKVGVAACAQRRQGGEESGMNVAEGERWGKTRW